jgi:hypothetical protein
VATCQANRPRSVIIFKWRSRCPPLGIAVDRGGITTSMSIAMRRNRLVGSHHTHHGPSPDQFGHQSDRATAYLGRIVGVLIRHSLSHDHAAGSIDRQMHLAPLPACLCSVFRFQPLTRPVDLQAGAVDQRCNGPCGGGRRRRWITANLTTRRLIVMWSGAEIVRSISVRTDVIKPNARETSSTIRRRGSY